MWANFKNLINHRELIIKLALKNLKVQYRRPFLGFLWAFVTPLITVIIFQIVFSKILRVPIKDYPFFIYLMTAIFPWRFFQMSLSRATNSILDNQQLVKGASFPRELIPISIVVAELINFIPSLCIVLIFLYCFRISFSFLILYLPAVILLHSIFIIGISLLVSALQVKYRDIKYIVEILIVGLFYLTPVFYSLDMVTRFFSKPFLNIYLCNPLVGMLTLYRASLLGGFIDTLPTEVTIFNTLGLPLILTFFLLFFGFYIFKRNEKSFSDYLLI